MSQQTALNGERRGSDSASQQLEELSATVARNRADIDKLQAAAEQAATRADATDDRATEHGIRMDTLETRFDLDREVIAQLQADGLLSDEHAAHLTHALQSSRKIGAAIGIVMADRKVSEEAAFRVLSRASQDTNRKLQVVAYEVVSKGDASALPAA
jgi:uncharacterized coiled-coil protein SlyX